jgi:predicted phage-related endonuclease|nr:hypothetical protein [Brevibacillus sp. WF146]
MMPDQVEMLASQILQVTREFHADVCQEESVATWDNFLEQRQMLMARIDEAISQGSQLSMKSRQFLQEAHSLDQTIRSLIMEQKETVQQKLSELQQHKSAFDKYNYTYGATAYGAFFDVKK